MKRSKIKDYFILTAISVFVLLLFFGEFVKKWFWCSWKHRKSHIWIDKEWICAQCHPYYLEEPNFFF